MGFGRPCAVEGHPQHSVIVSMLAQGVSPRAIAGQIDPPLRYTAIEYFRRKHLPYKSTLPHKVEIAENKLNDISEKRLNRVIERAAEAVSEGDISSLEYHRRRILGKLESLDTRRSSWLIEAQADRHWTACAQLDGINIRSLELQARLLGLDQAPAAAMGSMVISFTSNNIAVSHKPAELPTPDAVETIDITPVDTESHNL